MPLCAKPCVRSNLESEMSDLNEALYYQVEAWISGLKVQVLNIMIKLL